MKKHKILLLLLAISVTRCPNSSGSTSAGGDTPAPPANPALSLLNNYGQTVHIEVFTGTNLEYRDGQVLGKAAPTKLLPASGTIPTAVANGASLTFSITSGQSFILIVGVGSAYNYLNDAVYADVTSNRTVILDATGRLN